MSNDSSDGCGIIIGLLFLIYLFGGIVGFLEANFSILLMGFLCTMPVVLAVGAVCGITKGTINRKKNKRLVQEYIEKRDQIEAQKEAYLNSPEGLVSTEVKELKRQNKRLLGKLKELLIDIEGIDEKFKSIGGLNESVKEKVMQTLFILKAKRNGFQRIVTANKKRIKFLKKKLNELALLEQVENLSKKYKVDQLSDELDEHLYLKIKSGLNEEYNYQDFTSELISKIEASDDSEELEKISKLIESVTNDEKVG